MLTNGEFHSFLISRNILLFGIDVNSEEGVRVSYILRESVYPFLALIMLRGSRMTVVGRFEGNCFTFAVQVSHHALLSAIVSFIGYNTLPSLLDRLNQLITVNEPELVVLRTEREQRSLDQQIRREQEEEYYKSLQADKEKASLMAD